MIVVIEDDEQRLQLAPEAITEDLKDLDEVLIGEIGRKSRNGLDKVVRSRPGPFGAWGNSDEKWTRIESLDLERGALIGPLIDVSELTHDLDPDLGLQGDSVPDADALQPRGTWDGLVVSVEAGKQLSDRLRRVDGVHSDIVGGRASVRLLEGVGNVQNSEIESGTSRVEDELDRVSDLALDSLWPLLTGNVGQPWQPLDNHPVLVVPVLNPIVELCIPGHLGVDLTLQSHVFALEIGHSVLMMAHLLLHMNQLGWDRL